MKKTNKFLLLVLILSGATNNQISCMNSFFNSDQERSIELREQEDMVRQKNAKKRIETPEENTKLEKFSIAKNEHAKNRDNSLGRLSVLENTILCNICEFTKQNDLINLSITSKLLNELFNSYLETPISDSKRLITAKIDLNDTNFLTKFNKNLSIIQKKMLQFIKGTDRKLIIKFITPFGLSRRNYLPNSTDFIIKFEDITINKDNLNLLETNILDNVISRKDIVKSEIKKNKKAIIICSTLLQASLAIIFIRFITKKNEINTQIFMEKLEKNELNFYTKLERLIFGEKLQKTLTKTVPIICMTSMILLFFIGLKPAITISSTIIDNEIDKL